MTRAQIVILLLFLAVVGGGAAILGPSLIGTSRERPEPRSRPGPFVAVPTEVETPPPVEPERPFALAAVGPDGAIDAAALRLRGAEVVPGTTPARFRRTAEVAWVAAPGCAWAKVPIPTPTSSTRADEDVRVTLVRAAKPFALLVREADGAPAAGVRVSWTPGGPDAGQGRTDARGVLTIEDRAPGLVSIRVGGRERAGPSLRVVLGASDRAEAVLDSPWTVTGRVTTEEGAAVAGAAVSGIEFDGGVGVDTGTAADGTFRWRGPISERTVLVVRAPGRQEVAVEPPLPEPHGALASRVDVRLPPDRGRIAGRLRRRPGVAGAKVEVRVEPAVAAIVRELYGAPEAIVRPRVAALDADGRFEVQGLAPDVPVRVEVRGDVVSEDHIVVPGTAGPLDLDPKPSGPAAPDLQQGAAPPTAAGSRVPTPSALAGRVVDAEGKGLPGVTVASADASTVTDESGSFRLVALDARDRRVEAIFGWREGANPRGVDPAEFAPFARATVAMGGEPVSLVLPKASGIAMRLLDGIDDRPIAWARVVVEDGEGDLLFDGALATKDGAVTLRDLPPGAAGRVSVYGPGLRKEATIALPPGSVADVGVLRLAHGARVRGEVKDRAGRPVPGAVVAEVEDGWLKQGARDVARERDRSFRRAFAGENGEYLLEGLDASHPLALAVWAPGHAVASHRVLWTTGPDARLPVALAKGGRVRVVLSGPKGAPVSGAMIDLEDGVNGAHLLDLLHRGPLGGPMGSTTDLVEASSALLFEEPGKPGTYRLGPLQPGPYEIWVERPGYRPVRKKFTVPDDEPEGGEGPVTAFRIGTIELQVDIEPEPDVGR